MSQGHRKLKIAVRYYYTPTKVTKISNTNNIKYWQGYVVAMILIYGDGNAKVYGTLEGNWAVSFKSRLFLTI